MANTNLTLDQITNEALMILHQKLNFIGTISRNYDDSYKTDGAKGGDSIRIRLPNKFTVRSGKTLAVQDVEQRQVTLTTATQKGVDMEFSSKELTQDINMFAKNFIEPAMTSLASAIENDMISSVYKDIYNEVSEVGVAASLLKVLNVSKILTNELAPVSGRVLNLDTTSNVDLVDALKGLFNDPAKLSENFREGMVANNFLGFQEVFQNTHWPLHVTGTDDGTGDYLADSVTVQTGTAMTVDTGAGTWKKGDIFTIDNVFRVHPETKVSTLVLQRFVITADVGVSATTINLSPEVIITGGHQNVDAGVANNAKFNKIESDAPIGDSSAIAGSADYQICLGYHKDAFAFATADLAMPRGVHDSSRKELDGISMRMISNYDITNDLMPTRIDVLYGFKTLRPELAVRLGTR